MALQILFVAALFFAVSSAQKMVEEDPFPRRFVWIGGTTDDSFRIHLDIMPGDEELLVTTDKTNLAYKTASVRNPNSFSDLLDLSVYPNLRRIDVENLMEKTQYYIFLRRSVSAKHFPNITFPVGSIRTFPAKGKSAEVTVALGSCQDRAQSAAALREIAAWNKHMGATQKNVTFFMLHMGDLHYGNIQRNDTRLYAEAMRDVVTDSVGRRLFRNTHVAYGWDDHDYGANNADSSSLSRQAAMENYNSMVPRYPKRATSGVGYAFNVGLFRFIITDLRSEASNDRQEAMSPTQEKWLLSEFKNWRKLDALIWMSSRPWIAGADTGSDTWGGFARQRHRIANYIAKEKIDNLLVVGGDAHMIAADDGTNSYYADEALAHRGFPVLQAAPFSQFGSTKGGPYTHGCFAYRLVKNRQYAILTLKPTSVKKGGTRDVTMDFKGYRVSKATGADLEKKKPLLTLSMGTPFLATKVTKGGGNGSCSISVAPAWFYIVTLLVIVGVYFGFNFMLNKRKAQNKQNTIIADEASNQPLEPM